MTGDVPPKLFEGMDYLKWKREINIWRDGTSVKPEKQASVAILRIMDHKARDFATRLDREKLKVATGIDYVIKELDEFFEEDGTQNVFLAIENLEKFIRTKDMGMLEYIAEFGRKVDAISELLTEGEKPYHDGILAYRLLKQSSLSKEQQILVRATMPKLTFKDMENCLKRAFGDAVIIGKKESTYSDNMKIKIEPMDTLYQDENSSDSDGYDPNTFYQNNYRNKFSRGNYPNYRGSRGGRDRGSSSGYQKFNNNNYYQRNHRQNKDFGRSDAPGHELHSSNNKHCSDDNLIRENKKDRFGNVMKCNICDSKFHFARECPDKGQAFSKLR